MNNKRRSFVRNVGLSFLALPFATSSVFASNTKETLSSCSILKKKKFKGFELVGKDSFMLNDICKATPVIKKRFMIPDKKGLLVEINNKNSALLNERQLERYKDFFVNFKMSLQDDKVHPFHQMDLIKLTTPTKILKSRSEHDFTFENAYGNTICVHSSDKESYVSFFSG